MAYDWSENGDKSQPTRLPVGEDLDVQITKVIFANKNGTPFRTQSGAPKIMVIFADDLGRECAVMIALTVKAAWRLASILSCGGADLPRMKSDGVEPHHFADEAFATVNLVGRRLRIRVKSYVDERNLADEIVTIRPTAGQPPTQPANAPPNSSPSSAAAVPSVADSVANAVARQAEEGPPPQDEIPF
jgi:hypothetical protein